MLPPFPDDGSPEYAEYLKLFTQRFDNDPTDPEPIEVTDAREKRLNELYQILVKRTESK